MKAWELSGVWVSRSWHKGLLKGFFLFMSPCKCGTMNVFQIEKIRIIAEDQNEPNPRLVHLQEQSLCLSVVIPVNLFR